MLSNLLSANRKVRFDFESKAYSFGTCIQTQNVIGYLDNVTRPFLLLQTISRSRPGYILSQFSHRFTS